MERPWYIKESELDRSCTLNIVVFHMAEHQSFLFPYKFALMISILKQQELLLSVRRERYGTELAVLVVTIISTLRLVILVRIST